MKKGMQYSEVCRKKAQERHVRACLLPRFEVLTAVDFVACLGTETRSSDCWLVLFQSSLVVTTGNYYT
jgi:hypothetical protein